MLMNVHNVNQTELDNTVHVFMDIPKLLKITFKFVSIVLINVKLVLVLEKTVLSVLVMTESIHLSVDAQLVCMMMVLKMLCVMLVIANVFLVKTSLTTVPPVKIKELMLQNVHVWLDIMKLPMSVNNVLHNVLNV